MKRIIGAVALGLTILPAAALAQGSKSDSSSAPSAQSSGAGIPGHPGSKSGPAVKPGGPSAPVRRKSSRIPRFGRRTRPASKACRGDKSGLSDQQRRK